MKKYRRMNIDLALDNNEHPVPGDYVTTARSAYVVIDVRPVESRVWPNRWACTLRRIPGCSTTDPPPAGVGQRVHPVESYRRGEGPADFFGVTP